MSYETILIEKRDQIGIITLNRPQKFNTFNSQMAEELNTALLQLDERIRIGIQVNHMNDLTEKKEFRFLFRTGIGYYLSDICSISIEVTKESGRTVLTDAGMRYDFHPNIYARLGYNPPLSLVSFNIGYHDRQFRIEAGQAIHLSLGSTWGLSMMYIFNNDE